MCAVTFVALVVLVVARVRAHSTEASPALADILLLAELPVEPAKYVKFVNTYCGSDLKIGQTMHSPDYHICKSKCDAEPTCIAFEVFKGQEGCTLRPYCRNKRMSDKGTYVMVKESMLDEPTISPPTSTPERSTSSPVSASDHDSRRSKKGKEVKHMSPPFPVMAAVMAVVMLVAGSVLLAVLAVVRAP